MTVRHGKANSRRGLWEGGKGGKRQEEGVGVRRVQTAIRIRGRLTGKNNAAFNLPPK